MRTSLKTPERILTPEEQMQENEAARAYALATDNPWDSGAYGDVQIGEEQPNPVQNKSVIGIHATVHEEQGEWIDWWIDADDDGIFLPSEEDQCEKYLREYDIILVGDKWFPGKDADKAMAECYRQYKKVTILDDKDRVVAEIYDRQTMYDCTEDFGRYRWMSQNYGNIERSFADVLECAEDGDTYKHNYKGW